MECRRNAAHPALQLQYVRATTRPQRHGIHYLLIAEHSLQVVCVFTFFVGKAVIGQYASEDVSPMNPRWAKVGDGRRATTPSEHDLHGFLREGHPRVAVPVCPAVRSRPEGAAKVQEQEGGRDGQETRWPDDVPRVAGVHRPDQGEQAGREEGIQLQGRQIREDRTTSWR